MTAEAWLTQYDLRPTICPTWPASKQMVLVTVRDISDKQHPTVSEAHVLLSSVEMDAAADPSVSGRVLFFRVPRDLVIAACDELSIEDFN